MERTAAKRDEALVHELRLAVDEDRLLGPDRRCPPWDTGDVVLVVLAEVGRQRVGDRALLADPGDRDGGVQAAGEGDSDSLADGQRREDARHGMIIGAPAGRLGLCDSPRALSSGSTRHVP